MNTRSVCCAACAALSLVAAACGSSGAGRRVVPSYLIGTVYIGETDTLLQAGHVFLKWLGGNTRDANVLKGKFQISNLYPTEYELVIRSAQGEEELGVFSSVVLDQGPNEREFRVKRPMARILSTVERSDSTIIDDDPRK